MFKHSKWIISIIAVVLFFSGFQFITDASVVDGKNNGEAKVHQLKGDYNSFKNIDKEFDRFYKKFLQQCKIYSPKQKYNKKHYYKKKHGVNKPVENEKPNEEAPVEEGNSEETPVTPTEPKDEQPVEEEKQQEQPVENNKPEEEPAEQAPEQVEENNNENNQTEDEALYSLNEFEQQVFKLTNDARVSNGLQPLKIDVELSKVAREKSRDMAVNRYFSHTSPVYGSPFDMMRAYGISYRTAGENIAKGQRTPQEVVNAWMNSPGHRANILNSSFTHIGIGYVADGNHWTQQFIGK